ncbi:hypothetical protein [Salinivibrio sp. SS2]|uniref:hypothetical protein n=1 Tax=Salinivibrio sp. SS2 TaxID=1892894 RepID=UPI00084C64EE|nr:hypothetical protein [Salinivibrio sp. DV]ODQ00630.1 hypothetical protein BGK46_06160 [Salinivibrio sp. DV]
MNKLRKKGARSTLNCIGKADKGESKNRITTVKDNMHTTYKVTPITMRLPQADKNAVSDWVEELNNHTKRNVTPAKLMRGLAAMRDDIDQEKLLGFINDM